MSAPNEDTLDLINPTQLTRSVRRDGIVYAIPHGQTTLPWDVATHAQRKFSELRFAKGREKHVCTEACNPKPKEPSTAEQKLEAIRAILDS